MRGAFVAGILVSLIVVSTAASRGGDLDPAFSGDGWLRSRDFYGLFQEYMPAAAEDIALQSDGKIVGVGEIDAGYEDVFGAFRYTASGDLDRSFGEAGVAVVHAGSFPNPHG